jgi:hypothetical protein
MISKKREHNINDALRDYGLSVIIRTEDEFNHIKKFLGEDILYLDFVPQMATRDTGIIIWSENEDLSTGSVGCVEFYKENFIRVVEFNDFFKLDS